MLLAQDDRPEIFELFKDGVEFISFHNADDLRRKAGVLPRYQDAFVAHWLHRLIFYDLSQWVFAMAYGLFFALVVFTWLWVRPRSPRWWERQA